MKTDVNALFIVEVHLAIPSKSTGQLYSIGSKLILSDRVETSVLLTSAAGLEHVVLTTDQTASLKI